MNGFINLYKPSGISSAYALNSIKKKFRGSKVGHMGTLDPLAEGVLPVAIGKCTKLFDYMLDKTKVYIAEFTFGYETDTLDRAGIIINQNGALPSKEQVEIASQKLVGKISQIPPLYSAKNVNGEKSYNLARQGIVVDLKAKEVEIDAITLLDCCEEKGVYKFKIECKGGTYIRSICKDLASLLSTYATMTSLVRVQSGAFTLDSSITLKELQTLTDVSGLIVNPLSVLNYEKIYIDDKFEYDFVCGKPSFLDVKDGLYLLLNGETLVCLASVTNKALKIKVYFK
ncbi:MAG: tRNA pseudouridine(55) synthase TruB [Clostridia bacterium]|nr:tRNA pseudouridine(55) synthase TruB [Clostridia bacterium]